MSQTRKKGTKETTKGKPSPVKNIISESHSKVRVCKCKKCGDPLIENPETSLEESVECNSCGQWFHVISCTELTGSQFEFLREFAGDSILYNCIDCAHSKGRDSKVLKDLKDEFFKLTNSFKQIESNIVTMKMVEEKIEETFHNQIDAKIEAKIAEKFKHFENKVVNESVSEKEQQDKRKNNMIIVNIPESKDEDPADRKAHDTKFLSNIFSKIAPEADLSEISDPIRLGEVNTNGTPRLIKITFKNNQTKATIFKNATNLNKKETTPKERIYLNNDLTEMQRKAEHSKRVEIRELRKNNPDKIYHFKKGQIVESEKTVE